MLEMEEPVSIATFLREKLITLKNNKNRLRRSKYPLRFLQTEGLYKNKNRGIRSMWCHLTEVLVFYGYASTNVTDFLPIRALVVSKFCYNIYSIDDEFNFTIRFLYFCSRHLV